MFEESKTTERIQYLFDGYIAPRDAVTPDNNCTSRGSDFNEKCSNQANLLMIVNSENRHYATIKNFL